MGHNIATWAATLDWLVNSELICSQVIIASFVIDQSMKGQICTKAAWTARCIHNESPADTDSQTTALNIGYSCYGAAVVNELSIY